LSTELPLAISVYSGPQMSGVLLEVSWAANVQVTTANTVQQVSKYI